MKIRQYKLTTEEFKEQAEWIIRLISPLNNFMSDVNFAFNNNITIADNLRQEIKEIDHTENARNYPILISPKYGVPKGLQIIYCKHNQSTPVDLTAAPFINYEIDAQTKIKITSITGLVADYRYTIRIHVIYE